MSEPPLRRTLRYNLPWDIRPDHNNAAIFKSWKKYRRYIAGMHRSEQEAHEAREFIKYMDGENEFDTPLSIAYERQSGFRLVPHEEGNQFYISHKEY